MMRDTVEDVVPICKEEWIGVTHLLQAQRGVDQVDTPTTGTKRSGSG